MPTFSTTAGPAKRFNPAAHRPTVQRLRVGVRGAAGTRKSTFAASLAAAGLGKLCFFDTELKATHLPGSDGSGFDAYELADPDELEGAIRWAIHDADGQAQGYGCYALDSFNGWFAPTYAAFLQAKRLETGNPFPELDGADLHRLQVVCGEILRPLCVDSKACVVITDTIAGKGLEDKEDNEVGRIVPISASGLEYFVDVLVESELRIGDDGISEICLHRVIKSNNRAFPIGLLLENPTFKEYLERLNASTIATADTIRAGIDEGDLPLLSLVQPAEPTLELLTGALLDKVRTLGFSQENLVNVMRKEFGKYHVKDLSRAEVAVLDARLDVVAQKRQGYAAAEVVPQGGGRKRG